MSLDEFLCNSMEDVEASPNAFAAADGAFDLFVGEAVVNRRAKLTPDRLAIARRLPLRRGQNCTANHSPQHQERTWLSFRGVRSPPYGFENS
jgi:hypothetical protein